MMKSLRRFRKCCLGEESAKNTNKRDVLSATSHQIRPGPVDSTKPDETRLSCYMAAGGALAPSCVLAHGSDSTSATWRLAPTDVWSESLQNPPPPARRQPSCKHQVNSQVQHASEPSAYRHPVGDLVSLTVKTRTEEERHLWLQLPLKGQIGLVRLPTG